MDVKSMKDIACQEIDKHKDEFCQLSTSIWEEPELGFEERHAHEVLTNFLEKHDFKVERHFKLDTAFRAVYGEVGAGPHVAILCEYDALPEIGHACGHNLIAESGVAAGLGVKAAMKAAGTGGKLTILGTPAEENGGGKILLIKDGVFDDVGVAMMVHPSPYFVVNTSCLSTEECHISFHGKASHAAGFPWGGINALDAAVLCYQNISCLRQQIKPTWRVHGIITNGGAKPNIIPELSTLVYSVRAPSDSELNVLREKLVSCVEAAAIATDCKVDIDFEEGKYSNMVSNKTLGKTFETNSKTLGILGTPEQETTGWSFGSTDMGNVSYVVPSIHPVYYIGTKGAVNHTREFTVAAGTPDAQSYTLAVSKTMAMTSIDVLTTPEMLTQIKKDFETDMKIYNV